MDGFYLVQTCKSQNTTMFNAFGNDQNNSFNFFDAGEVFGRCK
jgi:hypothetical protein